MMTGKEVGKRVQDRRSGRGIKVPALATRAGLSEGYVYKLERGEVDDISYRVISQLAVALGFSGADELIGAPFLTPADLSQIYDQQYGAPLTPQSGRPDLEAWIGDTAAAAGQASELDRPVKDDDRAPDPRRPSPARKRDRPSNKPQL